MGEGDLLEFQGKGPWDGAVHDQIPSCQLGYALEDFPDGSFLYGQGNGIFRQDPSDWSKNTEKTETAPSVLHPQLIMAHYFVPAHIIPLVEIVGHPSNPEQLVPQFAACLSAMGMKPVVLKRFARGFIVNRIQRAINQELFQLLDDGVADAAALDDAVSVCLGARLAVMGYLSRLDFTGLDLVLSNYRQVPMGLATDETPPPLLERMVGEGRLGFKSGKGFYGYSGVTSEEVLRHRDARLLAVLRSLETINARFPSPSLEPANGGAWQNGPSSQKGEDT